MGMLTPMVAIHVDEMRVKFIAFLNLVMKNKKPVPTCKLARVTNPLTGE